MLIDPFVSLLFPNVRSIGWAGAALLLISLGASGWCPIARAAAYATLPGRTGTVLAVLGITAPFKAAPSSVVGMVASRWGYRSAWGCWRSPRSECSCWRREDGHEPQQVTPRSL